MAPSEDRIVKSLKELALGGLSTTSMLNVYSDDDIVTGFPPRFRLLPHQAVARTWMEDREAAEAKGGILADEMGMGKTIEMLVRIFEGSPSNSHLNSQTGGHTLIVAPVDLLQQWASEIAKLVPRFKVIQHHGPSRSTDPSEIRQADIVITSFSTVASEYKVFKAAEGTAGTGRQHVKQRTALLRVSWWRVVLDEAHVIKNHNTENAAACCSLQAHHRWCLTGTPIQNSVNDLYSLLRFLRMPPLSDSKHFTAQILKPIEAGNTVVPLERLHVVLKAIMLRRHLHHIAHQLPKRDVQIISCAFDSTEERFYTALKFKFDMQLDNLKKREILEKCAASVHAYVLRLRQACNHPYLMFMAIKNAPNMSDINDSDDDSVNNHNNKPNTCGICTASDVDNRFCDDCARIISVIEPLSSGTGSSSYASAKIRELMKILRAIKARSAGHEKTIIFSQFTKMLDLIQPFLIEERFGFIRYDGSLTTADRVKSLNRLQNDPSVLCALVSLKAGGTGLNLTACSNVIMVDIWWNPAIEEQAFGRVHRIGQNKPVFIYKLTIPNTIENRILDLQARKEALADAILDQKKIVSMKLSLDEVLSLFQVYPRA